MVEVKKWRDIWILQTNRFEMAGWPLLKELLRPEVTSITLVGGQHRKQAEKLPCDMYKQEVRRNMDKVLGLRREVVELQEAVDHT